MNSRAPNEKRLESLTVVELEPAPTKARDTPLDLHLGRWRRFRSWLGSFWREVFPNNSVEKELVAALSTAKQSGVALLANPMLRNEELEATIAKLRSETRKVTVDTTRCIAAFEAEQSLVSAQACKILEEAKNLRSERLLRTREEMRKIGIRMVPIFDSNGDLEALSVTLDGGLAEGVPEPSEENEASMRRDQQPEHEREK